MPDRANGLECPTLAEVGDFIAQNDARFDGRLSRYHNYSRVVSLCHFDQLVERDDLRQQATGQPCPPSAGTAGSAMASVRSQALAAEIAPLSDKIRLERRDDEDDQ